MGAPRNVRRIARVLALGVLAVAFVTTDAGYIGTACAIDKNTGKPTDPSGRGGKLPGRTGGQAGGCSQTYCEGVMRELGWKCSSVAAVLSGSGYCECQCKDQNGAVTNSKTTSAQHEPAGGGAGIKP